MHIPLPHTPTFTFIFTQSFANLLADTFKYAGIFTGTFISTFTHFWAHFQMSGCLIYYLKVLTYDNHVLQLLNILDSPTIMQKVSTYE